MHQTRSVGASGVNAGYITCAKLLSTQHSWRPVDGVGLSGWESTALPGVFRSVSLLPACFRGKRPAQAVGENQC